MTFGLDFDGNVALVIRNTELVSNNLMSWKSTT